MSTGFCCRCSCHRPSGEPLEHRSFHCSLWSRKTTGWVDPMVMITTGKDGEEKKWWVLSRDEISYILWYIHIIHVYCAYVIVVSKRVFGILIWNGIIVFKSSNRRQICADMLKTSWCFIFPVTGMTQLRFFVAVTINPWTVLLDQSQKGPRFKVASLQKLGHSASVVVVISMRVQYILEVIEDPIIWNVSFSLNWGEGKNVQVHLLFCEMFIWWCYFASMRFPRLTKGIYLVAFFVVSFTKVRALATYMKCLDPSWSACRCRIGWSVLSHLDLSKGGSEKGQVVWNQVLLMARHGAKRSRYIWILPTSCAPSHVLLAQLWGTTCYTDHVGWNDGLLHKGWSSPVRTNFCD